MEEEKQSHACQRRCTPTTLPTIMQKDADTHARPPLSQAEPSCPSCRGSCAGPTVLAAWKVRKKFFTMRVVRPWHRLPREAVAAPSLAAFKARLDGALSNLVWWKVSLLSGAESCWRLCGDGDVSAVLGQCPPAPAGPAGYRQGDRVQGQACGGACGPSPNQQCQKLGGATS